MWHKTGVRGRRLDGLVCNVLLAGATVLVGVGVLAFLATRTHMFHVAYMRRRQVLENNVWLLEQCKSPDFYGNMKHHSTLCDDVALAESDALWLHALRDVVDETHPCGEHSCAARVQHMLEWILGRGLLTFGGALFGLFVLFTLAVQLQRSLAPCPPYAAYAAYPPRSALPPHAQWYPLLTHSSADYRHED
jgi:hypothetical protein